MKIRLFTIICSIIILCVLFSGCEHKHEINEDDISDLYVYIENIKDSYYTGDSFEECIAILYAYFEEDDDISENDAITALENIYSIFHNNSEYLSKIEAILENAQ